MDLATKEFMKMCNSLFENKTGEFQIYCDLDGVLADFRKKCINAIGIDPNDKNKEDEFWEKLKAYGKQGNKIWEDLDMMPDGMDLWNFIKPFNPIICTASGGFSKAKNEKEAWVSSNLGDPRTIVVAHSKDKSEHATEKSILIDDQEKSINPWILKGGIGILHISAADTINKLKKLGFY